jgi:hypothetical protein
VATLPQRPQGQPRRIGPRGLSKRYILSIPLKREQYLWSLLRLSPSTKNTVPTSVQTPNFRPPLRPSYSKACTYILVAWFLPSAIPRPFTFISFHL